MCPSKGRWSTSLDIAFTTTTVSGAYQFERAGQWVKGKSCDTFAPLGPELVSAGEVDPHKLRLWLKVNGSTMQDSNTSDLIFGVPFLISYISGFMTLLPGDVISTGTPPGVGLGFKPPRVAWGGSASWLRSANVRSGEVSKA